MRGTRAPSADPRRRAATRRQGVRRVEDVFLIGEPPLPRPLKLADVLLPRPPQLAMLTLLSFTTAAPTSNSSTDDCGGCSSHGVCFAGKCKCESGYAQAPTAQAHKASMA